MKKLTLFLSLITAYNLYSFENKDIEAFIEVEKTYKADVKIQYEEMGKYSLIIEPVDSNISCKFIVKRIDAPTQIKRRVGIIWANKDGECTFSQTDKKELINYWNKVILFNSQYWFNGNKELYGNVKLKKSDDNSFGTISFNLE